MTRLEEQFDFMTNVLSRLFHKGNLEETSGVLVSSWHWAFENGLEDWPEETNA